MSERKPKPVEQSLQENAPWKPAPWTDETAGAIQALDKGTAAPHQQKLALDYIINVVSGTYDAHYHAGQDGQRNTDFALGRAFVGQQLVKLTKLNLTALRTGRRGEQG